MNEEQLDLFSHAVTVVEEPPSETRERPLDAQSLDAEALVAAIPRSSLADSKALAAEAGKRRLASAVPALLALCRRFAGFGSDHPVPEQAAALQGLVMIGNREAAEAVAQMLERAVVRGPTLAGAVGAAARLRSILSGDVLKLLLQHRDPAVRADACRCARPLAEVIPLLADLLNDLDMTVSEAGACALGRMGRAEALPMLKQLLRAAPSEEVIDAVSAIADEECMVMLGRIAKSTPALAEAARDALEGMDHPRAGAIAAAIRFSDAGGERPA